ncbi:MAG: ATP-binding protein [Verrucomicrobiaceae bacterium]|nr:ATP-binding protein [Verrucomicrobiaceae bacterium]
MPLFDFADSDSLGNVRAVDTANVVVAVENVELLRKLQVNRLVVLRSSKAGQHLVGVVQKIIRDAVTEKALTDEPAGDELPPPVEQNVVRITLIGTFFDKKGWETNVFRRTLESVPEIDALCFPVEREKLTQFMQAISFQSGTDGQRLSLGHYTLDESAEAFLNANRFFQRHAVIVGSTGSGKSWATARLIEQIAELPNANVVLFDIHGEYHTLAGAGVQHLRIAGPADLDAPPSKEVLFLPYWLLTYEDMVTMMIDGKETNAPNQAMVLARTVTEEKRKALEAANQTELLKNFTVDSPVPYDLEAVLETLRGLDVARADGKSAGSKAGDFNGKLTRFISRLENKLADRRLGFMMTPPKEAQQLDWLPKFSKLLLSGTDDQPKKQGGVKVIDFSEVPSDVLPLVAARIASLIFAVQQWTPKDKRHPIAIFCDEAHLYIPDRSEADSVAAAAVRYFERIAKEGRKYGVGLVVISQRPAEVNRTILSQCNNFIALRLTNAEDQSVVRRLLPDSLGGFTDLLPVLDTGEALVVGDACLLPSRIRITEPKQRPDSATVNFWDEWSAKGGKHNGVADAVLSWRRQSMT